MNIAGFVNELAASGIELWEEEAGRLRYRGPNGAMTTERREVLRVSKPEVLEYLRATIDRVTVSAQPQARHDPFPLTDVQSAYLLGRRDVFAYGGVACHAYGELRFAALDADRLEDAWERLVRRHDMLRAVVDFDGFQRVLPETPRYRIAVTDLRGRTSDAERALTGIRAEMDHQVHQPDRCPLYELRVTQLDDHALLHVSIDFLIADYVSIYLLLDELRWCYDRPDEQLPELAVTFRDYLRAERKLRGGVQYERDRGYWLDRLDRLPPAPELPVLEQAGRQGSGRFRRLATTLSEQDWKALRAQAGAHRVTASGAVFAAYAEVIARWSRNPRFTLDLTLLNRLPLHPDVGRVVGDFTSVELLAIDADAGPTFADRAVAHAGQLFADLDHRLFSGVEVLREIVRRHGQGAALMPVVFTSAIGLGRRGADAASRGELGNGISQTPQVWIDCQVMEQDGTLAINWDVREGVFADGLVDDMFAAFTTLLTQLATEPATWELTAPVSLPPAQSARRADVNATAVPRSEDLLQDGILASARRAPDRTAVIAGTTSLRYRDLVGRANAVAAALTSAGCTRGDLVAVVMDKGGEQVVGVLGVLLAGGAYLPVDTHQPVCRRDRILADAGVRQVLTRSGAESGAPWPADVEVIEVDLLAPVAAPVAPPVRCAPDDLAYVIYTSGSTGDPKGVMITHRAAVNTIQDINRRFEVGETDRVLGLANLGFDLSVYDVFGVLAVGGCLVLPDPARRADPSHWAALVAAHGVTLWNSVPAQLHMLNEYVRAEVHDELSSLRLAMMSGDWIPVSLPDALRARLPGLRLVGLGGATEAAIWSIYYPIGIVDPAWPSIPYGRPLANQRFHVLDRRLRPSPDLVPGDLYIAGDGLATGYLGDEIRTGERFFRHPETDERLYRTGDLGRYLPDGNIEFLGRDDRQVKVRGHRIELAEVEAALHTHPSVAASTALVDGDPPLDRRLVAFVEPARTGSEPARSTAGLVAAAEGAGAAARSEVVVDRVVRFARQLDRTALLTMMDVLRRSGLFGSLGDSHRSAEIMAAARVAAKHERLVRRWLAALTREGLLTRDGSAGRYSATRLVEPEDVTAAWREVHELLPDAHDRPELVHYFHLAAQHLPELLRDEQDPVQLLFPEGRLDIQEAAYSGGFLSRYLNGLVTATLRVIAGQHSGPRGLRLLEVGAGVGGTSVEAIPELADLDVSYLFTDVSQFFLNKASERFAEYPWVDYALFDMNEDFRGQGLPPNSVDVILCGNVMHYSRDADLVLARMRELLVAGGWLVYIETTSDNYQILTSMEFLFDATAGDFEDVRHGQDQTFISVDQWLELIDRAGGEVVYCLPEPEDALARIGMHVFAARFKADRRRLDPAELADHVAARVPEEMVPSQIHVVDSLPLTDNGKVDRATLESWLLPNVVRHVDHGDRAEPETELEREIGAIWTTVLGVAEVGRADNFYEIGGDSLLAAQVVVEMRDSLPQANDVFFDDLLRELLGDATVAGLATLLSDRAEDTGEDSDDESDDESDDDTVARPAVGGLAIVGNTDGAPVVVLVPDGLGAGGDRLAAALAARGPFVGLPRLTAAELETAPEVLVERVAADTARALKSLGPHRIHLVGAHAGGVLAAAVARHLVESGGDVALTVISSFPLPAVVDDDLVAEYLFAHGIGVDPTRLGFPVESAMGRAFAAVLAETPGHIPAGSMAALAGDDGSLAVARVFTALAEYPFDERLATLTGVVADANGAAPPTELVRQRFADWRAVARGVAVHELPPYAGDITVLRHTADTPLWTTLRDDVVRFWRDVSLGEVEVVDIAGGHFDCLAEEHAPELAVLITDAGAENL